MDQAHSQLLQCFLAGRAELLGFLGLLVPADLVEDAFQDTFLVLSRKLDHFDPERGAFAPWVRGIARNEARRLLRERRRDRSLPPEHVIDAIEAALSADAPSEPDRSALAQLRGCLERLTPAHRELVDQRYRLGRSLADLATALGQTAGAVQVRLSRIRTALRRCLSEAGVDRAG